MDNYTAVGIAEGWIECEETETVLEAWQHLIDTGQAWQLQGWFGRTAMYLIQEGHCKLPESSSNVLKDISKNTENHER